MQVRGTRDGAMGEAPRMKQQRLAKLERALRPPGAWHGRTPYPELTEDEQELRMGQILLAMWEAYGDDGLAAWLVERGRTAEEAADFVAGLHVLRSPDRTDGNGVTQQEASG